MSLSLEIKNKLNSIPPGIFFKSDALKKKEKDVSELEKALRELVKDGVIEMYKPGIYFKPKFTDFGKLPPSEDEKIKLLLEENPTSYISGTTIANALGLTTQISNELIIITDKPKKSEFIGNIKVRYLKGLPVQQKGDVELLRILDMIKNFKKLPDVDAEKFIKIIAQKISSLTEDKIEKLLLLGKKYNPASRALLGAIFQKSGFSEKAEQLKNTLNPKTYYNLNISKKVLPNKSLWRIR